MPTPNPAHTGRAPAATVYSPVVPPTNFHGLDHAAKIRRVPPPVRSQSPNSRAFYEHKVRSEQISHGPAWTQVALVLITSLHRGLQLLI